MQNSLFPFSDTTIGQLLDAVETGVVLLDSNKKVVVYNSFADTVFDISRRDLTEPFCCNVFLQSETFCRDCPLDNAEEGVEMSRSYTIEGLDGQTRLAKVILRKLVGLNICTVKDVTKEVKLIKKIDLQKKEAEAKNILMERRYDKLKEQFDLSEHIIHNLPEALISVDQDFTISQMNKFADELFAVENPHKCYELMGQASPCEHCPAQKGFDFAHEFKKRHKVGDRYYSELILRGANDNSGFLLFSDTTSKINLINKIDNHQTILTRIVELSKIMQNETNVQFVLDTFMGMAMPSLSASSALLIVNDIRPGSVLTSISVNLPEAEVENITRAYLSRETQAAGALDLSAGLFPWKHSTVIALRGGHGKRVGMLALDVKIHSGNEEQLDLFTDTVGAYLHNQLLMKQLEESANTDPLTGLYNRRYFENAFAEEVSKFEKYAIHFSVVSLDVNQLKKANDTYGHEVGDALISRVADLLSGTARQMDIVARTGGDEFIVLLVDTKQKAADEFCLRLRDEVFCDVFLDLDGGLRFPVTASAGCAGTDVCRVDTLLNCADEGMYVDKKEYYTRNEAYR